MKNYKKLAKIYTKNPSIMVTWQAFRAVWISKVILKVVQENLITLAKIIFIAFAFYFTNISPIRGWIHPQMLSIVSLSNWLSKICKMYLKWRTGFQIRTRLCAHSQIYWVISCYLYLDTDQVSSMSEMQKGTKSLSDRAQIFQ